MKVLRAAACFGFAWLLVFRAGELRAQAQDPNESFQPPWAEGDVLVADWRVVGLVSHPEFLRYRFSRGEGDGLEMAYVEINRRSGPDAQFTTERYEVQPSPEGFAPPAVVDAVLRGLREAERRSAATALRSVLQGDDPPDVLMVHRSLLGALFFALMATIVGIFRCRKRIAWRVHVPPMMALTALGALARIGTGVLVPGFEGGHGHAHGFGTLSMLLGQQRPRIEPHGNGQLALAQLALEFLPAVEASILALQTTLSILTVPLVYVGAMGWLRSRRHALTATTIYALLPSVVYFAQTEVRLVPGAFFVAASLALGGAALSLGSGLLWLAAGLCSVIATQFHPVLLPAPLVLGLLLVARWERSDELPRWPMVSASCATVLAYGAALSLVWANVQRGGDGIIGSNTPSIVSSALASLVPTFSLNDASPFAAFLNAQTTPLVLCLFWFYGLAQIRDPKERRPLIALSLAALGMTLTGIAGGRYNLARLQLGAAPLHGMLTSVGFHAAWAQFRESKWASRLRGRSAWVFGAATLLALLLPGLLGRAWILGPLGQSFAFAGERQVFLRALPELTEDCEFWVAPSGDDAYSDAPAYLGVPEHPASRWHALEPSQNGPDEISQSMRLGRCAYYYRSATCFAVRRGEPRRATLLRPECEGLELALELVPVHVEQISATPSAAASYSASLVDVGVFRVRSVRRREPLD